MAQQTADGEDVESVNGYLVARVSVSNDLQHFLSDHEHSLTYEAGSPLRDAAEALDASALDADPKSDEHEKVAKSVADRLDRWLDQHGDEVSFADGYAIEEMVETLRTGDGHDSGE